MIKGMIALGCGLLLIGCSGGSANVSASEEENFKNPKKVDMNAIPPGAIKPSGGPAFVGEPTQPSAPGSAAPPPAATTGG